MTYLPRINTITIRSPAYDKAIEIDPNNAEAWFNKGFALGGMGRYDEAIAAFDTVKTINPAYPRLAYYRYYGCTACVMLQRRSISKMHSQSLRLSLS